MSLAAAPAAPFAPPPRGNGWIAFTSDRDGNAEVYRADPDGQNQVNLTGDPANDRDPAWSPDGTRIAFTSDRTGDDRVFLMNADGSGVQQLTFGDGADRSPAWSPDGRRIAFVNDGAGDDDVYLVNADGSGLVRLTSDPGSDRDPAWSPNGSQIAFTSDRTGDDEVFVMKSNGSQPTDLTMNPAADRQPAWSPDAKKIAFTTDRDGNGEVYTMSSGGSKPSNLSRSPGADSEAAYAPELGYKLVYTSDRSGEPELYVAWRAGTGQVSFDITNTPGADSSPSWQPLQPRLGGWPIEHVVVIFQENQSFNELLGGLCLADRRCGAVAEGRLLDGSTVPLARPPDIVPQAGHSWYAQHDAINGGAMNGFELIDGCGPEYGYGCYVQYQPDQIPNLAALARAYALSDRTFETNSSGSWGAHLELAAPDMNGFYQGGHSAQGGPDGPGGGCDSGKEGPWAASWYGYFAEAGYPNPPRNHWPACVPMRSGAGPWRPSVVPWAPTIMDRMDGAGRSWKIYAPQADSKSYGWSICPTYADCLYTAQARNFVPPGSFLPDVQAGALPALSVVVPYFNQSQHNGASMIEGDNWIAALVSAIMASPDWENTAIFITWDDCGCFYDQTAPPPNAGIRVPMLMVSPWARAGYTDSQPASFASLHAFAERAFGLPPMSPTDATAYDFSGSFDFHQAPLPGIALRPNPVPASSRAWIAAHPLQDEAT